MYLGIEKAMDIYLVYTSIADYNREQKITEIDWGMIMELYKEDAQWMYQR